MIYRRQSTGWTDDPVLRGRYERDARLAYPDFTHRRIQRQRNGPVRAYTATVPITGFPHRKAVAEFDSRWPSDPRLFADGPTDSPHRYPARGRTELCVWYPGDPPTRRWVPTDGLLVLFAMISEHLFKEAWWRANGVWLGDEAPHALPAGDGPDAAEEQS